MLTVADIQRVVAQAYDVPMRVMLEPDGFGTRMPEHVWPRQMAMALSREIIPCFLSRGRQAGRISMAQIGRRFGGRDPTTVRHAVEAVAKRREFDPVVRSTMRLLTRRLRGAA